MQMAIASSVLERIVAAARAEPEREVCGLLFGDEAAILRAEPAANLSPEPADSFELDPQALFGAIRAERAGGARLLGHYHSHPCGPAEPSARDAAAAEPGRLWLIVGQETVRLWLARGGGGFAEVALRSL